jgi:hypothetical protein
MPKRLTAVPEPDEQPSEVAAESGAPPAPVTAPEVAQRQYPISEYGIRTANDLISNLTLKQLSPRGMQLAGAVTQELTDAIQSLEQQKALEAELTAVAAQPDPPTPAPAAPARATRARAVKEAAPSKRTTPRKAAAAKATARRK